MRRFHLISLQRTASKALEASIHQMLKDDRAYLGVKAPGENQVSSLGEYLHCWGKTNYTFHPSIDRPFGHEEDVVFFKGHEHFLDPGNVQFHALYDKEEGQFVWTKAQAHMPQPHHEQGYLESNFYDSMRILKHVVRQNSRAFVLKTQLGQLLSGFTYSAASEVLRDLKNFHAGEGIIPIHLTRSDTLSWLCSVALTYNSGVFVSSQAQRDAQKRFLEKPLHVDKSFLLEVEGWYTCHMAMRGLALLVITEKDFGKLGPLGIALPENTQEFNSVPYESMISNYSYVAEFARHLEEKFK